MLIGQTTLPYLVTYAPVLAERPRKSGFFLFVVLRADFKIVTSAKVILVIELLINGLSLLPKIV